MRTHGWGGNVPTTDEEAVDRILAATRATIDNKGEQTRIADVARELGVTRQTVYRYFGSTEDLLLATSVQSVAPFMDRLAADLRSITSPEDAIVEGVAMVFERLPHEPYLGLLLRSGTAGIFAVGVTSTTARAFGRSMITRLDVDWEAAGIAATDLDDIVEMLLRTLQSLVLDPGDPPRSPEQLRHFLRRWIAPAIASITDPAPA